MNAIQNRYDFVLLFDVADGNPNGDPDAGNMPRFDPETGQGLVTDVCLKRKLRNFVAMTKDDHPPFEIYVKEGAVLNRQHERGYKATGTKLDSKKKPKHDEVHKVQQWMCENFYDVRTFGAVMGTEVNAGQVRGPIQLTFARSIDPVFARDFAITRMAVTNERDVEKERTIGRKHAVAYGLYRAHGFVSAKLAEKSGFSNEDLALFWRGLAEMFEHDHSAARGMMATRELVVFRHESALGNASSQSLFERVHVRRRTNGSPPRSFSDYEVSVDEADLPARVKIERPLAAALA
jgi:CRISPR-associated protein Csd2